MDSRSSREPRKRFLYPWVWQKYHGKKRKLDTSVRDADARVKRWKFFESFVANRRINDDNRKSFTAFIASETEIRDVNVVSAEECSHLPNNTRNIGIFEED